ncbi:hypothetical protein QFZ21_004140 [Microbacterium sp. W4I20]|nr:hypothetical protein [Microbacterium sp. W4I20]
MRGISKVAIAAVIVAGLIGMAGPASAASTPNAQSEIASQSSTALVKPMAKPATCVQGNFFQAQVSGGLNTSVLIRNNCSGSVKVQAQYKMYNGTGIGGITYHWGSCVSIGGGGKTWSSPLYHTDNLTVTGRAWANSNGKAVMQTC